MLWWWGPTVSCRIVTHLLSGKGARLSYNHVRASPGKSEHNRAHLQSFIREAQQNHHKISLALVL